MTFNNIRGRLALIAINVNWGVRRKVEKLKMALIWLLPDWIVYWCVIRAGAHATTGKWSNEAVPETTLMDVLKRWGDQA